MGVSALQRSAPVAARLPRVVAPLPALLDGLAQPAVRHLKFGVRKRSRIPEEERPARMLLDEVDGLVVDDVRHIDAPALVRSRVDARKVLLPVEVILDPVRVLRKFHPPGFGSAAAPQVAGIVVVGLPLAVVPVELVDGLEFGRALRARVAQSPFAEHPRLVSGRFQQFEDLVGLRRNRLLPLAPSVALERGTVGVRTVIFQIAPYGGYAPYAGP